MEINSEMNIKRHQFFIMGAYLTIKMGKKCLLRYYIA